MRKTVIRFILALYLLGISISSFSQNITLTGNIRNSTTKEVVPAVSVEIKGTEAGTFTDEKGNFKITPESEF